jgi:hypothetical protein
LRLVQIKGENTIFGFNSRDFSDRIWEEETRQFPFLSKDSIKIHTVRCNEPFEDATRVTVNDNMLLRTCVTVVMAVFVTAEAAALFCARFALHLPERKKKI